MACRAPRGGAEWLRRPTVARDGVSVPWLTSDPRMSTYPARRGEVSFMGEGVFLFGREFARRSAATKLRRTHLAMRSKRAQYDGKQAETV